MSCATRRASIDGIERSERRAEPRERAGCSRSLVCPSRRLRLRDPFGSMRGMSRPPGGASSVFACGNALLASALLGGVFGALPVRYWAVDAPSVLMAALLLISAYGLLRRCTWGMRALRISALCELAFGLAAIAALVLGVSYLGGVHGEVGRGGFIVSIVGSALLFPYLVVYPSLQLLWIHRATEPPTLPDARATRPA
jgi:hypothetical protein